MAAPVWLLSVDLQTKTATFNTGLADAAKNARGAFQDIKSGANDMGTGVGYSMTEARHGVMLLGEEFGVRLPRALTSFIAGLGPIGAAMEAAFPFLAIAVGATLLIQHLEKMREAGETLTQDQMKFGTTVNNVWNGLDTKILQAQIRADDLNHNHLKALDDQLQVIDRESMDELVHSFEEVAKAGDVVMKELESHWYSFGTGSEGAKHALDDFKVHYDMLLAAGKEEQASGLLHGTQQQAQSVLGMLQQAQGSMGNNGGGGDYSKFEEAKNKLRQLGVTLENTTTASLQKQIEAQQNLVDVLNAQVGSEERIAQLKSLQGSNAHKDDQQKDAQAAKERERQLQEALKGGRDLYLSELVGQYKANVAVVQAGEQEQIEATRTGSMARLAAIQNAMLAERQMGLEDSAYYRRLQQEEIEAQRQYDDEQAKMGAEAGREAADNAEKMGELKVAAERQQWALENSAHRENLERQMQQETQASNELYAIKLHALMDEAAALDKGGADYDNKLKALQDKERQLVLQHENEVAAIRQKASQATNQSVLAAWQQFSDQMSRGLTQSIMGHESWSRMITQFGNEAVSGMLQNAIKSMMVADMGKEKEAAKAARAAFNIGMSIGGPAGIVLGPVFGAAAFAAEMAFQGGGVVPGTGSGDIVPAMLEPGEGVVPKGVMDGLQTMARNGGMGGGGTHYHVHGVTFAPNVQAVDAEGVDKMLTKHQDTFERHFERTLRRMNK